MGMLKKRAEKQYGPEFSPDSYGEYILASALDAFLAQSEGVDWTQQNDYDWNIWQCGGCGEEWAFDEGTPADNNVHYCHNCGAKIRAFIPISFDDYDDDDEPEQPPAGEGKA